MNWTFFWGLALSLLLVSVVTAFMVNNGVKIKSNRFITPFNIVFGGVYVTTFVLLIPVYNSVCDGTQLQDFKTVMFAFLGALQVFTINLDASLITENITEAVGAVAPLYSAFLSVLFIIAPMFTFGFLISFFKNISAYFQLLLKRGKDLYVFSELNDKSIALAESIYFASEKHKPVTVFTDVFSHNEEEDYELIQRARDINAIIFKKDIARINFGRKNTSVRFFLMDNNEIGNLQTLSSFGESRKTECLKKSDEIYIFGKEECCRFVVNSIRECLKKKSGDNAPSIIVVDGTKNLIYNLLKDKPLFSAKSKSDCNCKKELKIAIFGSGEIGTEMFLDTYWCGQMLNNKLMITIISKEPESDFTAKINHLNPDILETADENSELLKIYADKDVKAEPYFQFEYVEKDIRKDNLYSKLTEDGKNGKIVDADYFVVALGTDEDNLEIADTIGRIVSTRKISLNNQMPVPVAYAIFNDKLNRSLKINGQSNYKYVDMFPFASLSETYEYGNITFDGIKNTATSISNAYYRVISNMMGKYDKYYKDSYSYWSNVARAIHIQYKAFSAGKSVEEYRDAAEDKGFLKSELGNELAWLEHRRWNAFMRTRGFRKPSLSEEQGYISELPDCPVTSVENQSKHKSISLKLHPCIVECDKNGIKEDVFHKSGDLEYDLLDNVSQRINSAYPSKNLMGYDFKKYDYSDCDF